MATAAQKAPRKNVRPDSKGRVTLGELTDGVSSYDVHKNADGSLLLEPKVEIPAREAWLFKNPSALASVRQGLKESAQGKATKGPSYAKHATDPDE